MPTIPTVLWFAITAFVALLMWAARVSPEQAESNLSGWLRKFGVENPPVFIRKKIADRRIRLAAFATLLLLMFTGGIGTDRWFLPNSPSRSAKPPSIQAPANPAISAPELPTVITRHYTDSQKAQIASWKRLSRF
jgi:hypothetical protein